MAAGLWATRNSQFIQNRLGPSGPLTVHCSTLPQSVYSRHAVEWRKAQPKAYTHDTPWSGGMCNPKRILTTRRGVEECATQSVYSRHAVEWRKVQPKACTHDTPRSGGRCNPKHVLTTRRGVGEGATQSMYSRHAAEWGR